MFKIGFFGGKMLPVHIGHVFCIKEAAKRCEELHVLLFHSLSNEQSLIAKSVLPKKLLLPEVREWVLREEFKGEKNIFIHAINGSNCMSSETLLNSDNFDNIKLVTEIIHKFPDVIFSSESSYSHFFEIIYPNTEHVIIDEKREHYPISGTLVRGLELDKALEFLPESYKRIL